MTNEIDGKKIRQMILSLRNCTKEERSDTMEYLRDLLYHGDIIISGLSEVNNFDEVTVRYATKQTVNSAKKYVTKYLSHSSDEHKEYGDWMHSCLEGLLIFSEIASDNDMTIFEECLLRLKISEIDMCAFDLKFMHKLIDPKYVETVNNIKRYELLINEAVSKGYYYVSGYHDYIDIDMIMSLIHDKSITVEAIKLIYPDLETPEPKKTKTSTKKESKITNKEKKFINKKWSETEMRNFLIEARKMNKREHMEMYGVSSYRIYNTRLNKIKCYFGMPYVDWDSFWGEPIRGRRKKNSI